MECTWRKHNPTSVLTSGRIKPILLQELQRELSELYEIDIDCDVGDFLVTDPATARHLQGGLRTGKEQLLISQENGVAYITLYLDRSILLALERHDPQKLLNCDNLNPYCIALEGISHFLYLIWRIGYQRPVTQLELELQAEIDKYIFTSLLFLQQYKDGSINSHELLFERVSYHPDLSDVENSRYVTANRYAAKYCNTFKAGLHPGGVSPSLAKELRRFYRLPLGDKLRRIDGLH